MRPGPAARSTPGCATPCSRPSRTGCGGSGERLPDEQSLARETPFSLGTVQRALGELASAGVITRRRGRGTFVAAPRPRLDTPLHLRFEDGQGGYLPVYPRIVRREPVRGHGAWSEALGGEGTLLRIDRVYSVDDRFRAFSRFYVDAAQFPVLARWPLRRLHVRNFKQVLAAEHGARVVRLDQRLRALALPAQEAAAMALDAGAPGLVLALTAFAPGGRALYFQEAFVPQVPWRLHLPEGGAAL